MTALKFLPTPLPPSTPSSRLEAWLQPLLVFFAVSPFLAIAAWLLSGSVG